MKKEMLLVAILFSLAPVVYLGLANVLRIPTALTLKDSLGIGCLTFIFFFVLMRWHKQMFK